MDCCEDAMTMYRVVCPKPRRVAPPNLNTISLAPSRFPIRNDFESNDGDELLGLILRQEYNEADRCAALPFSLGSPPCRTQNPLIQDEDFRVQKLMFLRETSSFDQFRELGKKQGATRLEGF